MNLAACIRATLIVDELGLVSARLGDCWLSTRFLALHRHESGSVAPAAAMARLAARCGGTYVGLVRLMAALPAAERLLVDCAARAAHVANVAACDPLPAAPVFLDVDPASIPNERLAAEVVEALGAIVALVRVDPRRLVLRLRATGWARDELASVVADGARHGGMGISLAGFEGSGEDSAMLDRIDPDYVAFAPSWYRQAARSGPARALLRAVAAAIRDHGAVPVVPAIDDAWAYREALGMGPLLMGGRFLAPAISAGGTFEGLHAFGTAQADDDGKVVRLFG